MSPGGSERLRTGRRLRRSRRRERRAVETRSKRGACTSAVVEQEQSAQTNPVDDVESDIPAGTKFLHADVSAWPVTAKLVSSVSGGNVSLAYDKADTWFEVDGCNANPWVFVNLDGQWYAATFEWLRGGQTSKDMGGKSWGDHIKVSPLSGWEI